MFRELHEEVGLKPEHVRIVARTRNWLRYEVPDRFIRRESRGFYKGQKQIWFLLQLLGNDWDLNLRATEKPEFDAWRWNDYWVPLEVVVEFKRGVYEMALTELARYLPRRENRGSSRYLRQSVRGAEPENLPPLGYGATDIPAQDAWSGRPAAGFAAPHLGNRPLDDRRFGDRRLGAERGRSLLLSGLHLDLPPDASFDPDPQGGSTPT